MHGCCTIFKLDLSKGRHVLLMLVLPENGKHRDDVSLKPVILMIVYVVMFVGRPNKLDSKLHLVYTLKGVLSSTENKCFLHILLVLMREVSQS